jgi:HPt (histidine-containing phosphotransfer) domain-containing protein
MEPNSLVPDEALLNERIKHLTHLYFSGKTTQAKSVLELYMHQSRVYLKEAQKALQNESVYDAKNALHRWRPSLPMVGLNELHDAVAHLEQQLMLKAIAAEVALDTLEEISHANEACCEHLKRIIAIL